MIAHHVRILIDHAIGGITGFGIPEGITVIIVICRSDQRNDCAVIDAAVGKNGGSRGFRFYKVNVFANRNAAVPAGDSEAVFFIGSPADTGTAVDGNAAMRVNTAILTDKYKITVEEQTRAVALAKDTVIRSRVSGAVFTLHMKNIIDLAVNQSGFIIIEMTDVLDIRCVQGERVGGGVVLHAAAVFEDVVPVAFGDLSGADPQPVSRTGLGEIVLCAGRGEVVCVGVLVDTRRFVFNDRFILCGWIGEVILNV